MKNVYPNLPEISLRFHIRFSTTYICETAFSVMTVLKKKQTNRLKLSDFLRLANTSIHRRINPLTPNDHYSGRTAPLTSKFAFYIFIQQI